MTIKTMYQTTNGKTFESLEEAKKHESGLVELKKSVKEDLSKILIKLETLTAAKVGNDDGYYDISNSDKIEDLFLCSLKTILKDLINGTDYEAQTYLTNYYDSSCY